MELLGQGGMGAVYKARQPKLDRLVAVKILPLEIASDAQFAERFLREARALASLSHPHIVAVYDFGEAGGLFYFVMEYVDGVNLRQMMRAGELSPREALAIVPQICEALQYAHEEEIVHRDIKPENILVDKGGRVKIADFGLAKLLGQAQVDFALTRTQQVMGTPQYMAPEQIETPQQVDHRADIYSPGVVFYEMLTGELPIGRFDTPSQKVQVDVRLDDVVLKSLEKKPERRYQHASDVKTDVESISSSEMPSRPTSQRVGVPPIPEEAVDAPPFRTRGIQSNSESDSAVGKDEASPQVGDAEEKQRTAELAQIPPGWLPFAVVAAFMVGWIFVGAMWNLRTPGLWVGFTVLAAITYGVVRCQLVYLPELRAELARQSKFRRGLAFVFSALFFALAMMIVTSSQVAIWDLRGTMPDRDWLESMPYNAVGKDAVSGFSLNKIASLDHVTEDQPKIGFASFRYGTLQTISTQIYRIVLYCCVAPFFAYLSVFAIVDTRRYRQTWKNSGATSFSTAVFLMVALEFMHVGRSLPGYAWDTINPREARSSATSRQLETAIDTWAEQNGYDSRAERTWSIYDGEMVPAGTVRMLVLSAPSPFDRYRVAGRFVIRPLPAIRIKCVSVDEPAESYVRVDLPWFVEGSGEETIWTELLNGLTVAVEDAAKKREP